MTPDSRRAWATYEARNRRANVQYAWLPIAHQHHTVPTPCHVCRCLTVARTGVCRDCTDRDRL